jgi:hypothetical protein
VKIASKQKSDIFIFAKILRAVYSSCRGTVFPNEKLYETVFLYSLIEKRMFYFSLLFDHTSTDIIINFDKICCVPMCHCYIITSEYFFNNF